VLLRYSPGRVISGDRGRQPVTDDGEDAWFTFVNNKASLCNVAGEDWNKRSRWVNLDISDLGDRTYISFGSVIFRNINVQCQTANGLAISTLYNTAPLEKAWLKRVHNVFRAYDTAASIDSWRISDCGTEAAPAEPIKFRRGSQTSRCLLKSNQT